VEAGGDESLAAAFVQPLAKPVERVLFWRRAGAYAIDVLLLFIALGALHGLLTLLLAPDGPNGTGGDDAGLQDRDGWITALPWGYHDPALPVWVQAIIAGASALLVLGYFTWLESREGRSLGKRALGLRVVRVDGNPMTVRAAFLRNLVKLSPLLLILDTIVMLVAFKKDRQRVSDKVAETIVIRT